VDIKPHLKNGFPWHRHDAGHEHLQDAQAWWAELQIIFASAVTGWEKPNPRFFRHALQAVGNPSRVWMVGDNPIADVAGAEAVGIPALLVRHPCPATGEPTGLRSAVETIRSP
jgi:FMN phosphatase YigB (HAD superfamily)